jgi:hypothetical protein
MSVLEQIESWRKCWRDGVAPALSDAALAAMVSAIEADDPALIQGATTYPPPLHCNSDLAIESACLIGLAGMRSQGLETVGEVEFFFAKTCQQVNEQLGVPDAVRDFLNWFDDTPREQMRQELLPELNRAILERQRWTVA